MYRVRLSKRMLYQDSWIVDRIGDPEQFYAGSGSDVTGEYL